MYPSPPPDPGAGRPWRARPPRQRPFRHPWLVGVFALLLGLLLIGGLRALLDDGTEPSSSQITPSDSTSQEPQPRSSQPTSSQPTSSPPVRPSPAPHDSSTAPHDSSTAPPAGSPPGTRPAGVVVVRVIDGDTVEVRGDGRIVPDGAVARVRLLEIDTPERGACYAAQATSRTTELLPPGSTARAERDDELTDRYDRYLLYLWNEQGVFVNESLVRSGHAEATLFPPNDAYWPTISRAEDAARRAGAGLWSACSGAPASSTPQQTPQQTPQPPPPATPARPDLPDGPPAGIPDVDCSDLPGPVYVGPDDPHRLDRDGDGIGCDSN